MSAPHNDEVERLARVNLNFLTTLGEFGASKAMDYLEKASDTTAHVDADLLLDHACPGVADGHHATPL